MKVKPCQEHYEEEGDVRDESQVGRGLDDVQNRGAYEHPGQQLPNQRGLFDPLEDLPEYPGNQ